MWHTKLNSHKFRLRHLGSNHHACDTRGSDEIERNFRSGHQTGAGPRRRTYAGGVNKSQPARVQPVPLQAAAAAAGVVSVAAGVVAGELVAALVSPALSPLTGVGGAVIDAVPPAVKDWAIAVFGTADKVALLVGMGLVIASLAAFAGVLEWRRRFAGFVVIAVFGVAGLVAVLGRAQVTGNAIALPLLAAGTGILVLRWLLSRLRDWTADDSAVERPGPAAAADRRRFLQALGGGAVVVTAGGVLAAALRGAVSGVSEFRSRLALPSAASPAPPLPAGAELGLDGISPLVTPNRDFYRIDTALTVPAVDPETWVLRVTGMVEREIELDFATLLSKPMTERHVTIACVSNEVGGGLIGNALWLGWPVRELLAMAGTKAGADMVLSRSKDGWTAGTPLEVLTDDRDALIAVGMNGEPLPLEHGFPVRLIVPGLYGYVSATKWLTELKVTRFADDVGYWTPRGWSERGPIKTSSRIDVPRAGRPVRAGAVAFGGVAWAQHTGIGKVELRVNRGDWQAVELAPGISRDTWYQWRLSLTLTAGQYEIQVRATDLNGVPQIEEPSRVAPDGATGFHTIRVDVTP